ncbi:malonate decarboxylase acyl carrier protein [Micromonospora sp. NPDC047707]|uniref:malonate decarboxylase acyl carrier protein n=1 Tax=Micromonospora sp. NPDC047707 TaxID=3154498 RepID=UPI0034560AF0
MQSLTFVYDADMVLDRPIHVGVVASGDLEIVIIPEPDRLSATVALRTSVDGFDAIWERVLDRFFKQGAFRARYQINDFGATPGLVSLRLAQARELAVAASESEAAQ